ncbi:hypothetical protein BGW36DRAFT_381359 [Talaromyces proteolyticus]|uniref:N-acetyltransferase domain-containing protein n=1 Tax=Talaromyces proteolyticus TaxID=1131652 RepID=A0AAD4PXQ0_9EURO|nr:uncharacterized protein BGW36DRAFT_381359 [Talaromyces proteolyticus]KAH8696634.1 hypothetical protein BGW36DRAFT_381359 [Talaromyces proteolyticus]
MHKRGIRNNINLLIGNVHTTPEYRNKGFIRYMIGETIEKYEIPGYKFGAVASDNEDADAYIAEHIRPDTYEYYWTLYSGVSEMYAKFGFKSVPEMNWLIYEEPVLDKSHPPPSGLEPYQGVGTQVTFLKTDSDLSNLNQYFSDPAYASYVNSDVSPMVRSTSLHHPMVHNFYARDAVASAYYGRSYNYVGLKIAHSGIGKQTFAIFSGALDYSGILVQKLFTDLRVDNESQRQLLVQDLAYVVKFLRHVHVADYSLLDRDFISSIKLMLTTQDICTKDRETHDYVISTLEKSNWRLDTSNSFFLPMMKDWAKPGITEGVKWINNGFWCFG